VPRGPCPRRLHIQRDLLRELKELVWRGRDIHLIVQRARIVLLSHEGRGTEEIANIVGWTARAVRKWKARFENAPALATLRDAARSGRPSRVPLSIRCQLVRLACERPNHEIMRFRDVWTYASLSDVLAAKTGYRLSTSEIGRILRFKEIRPHHVAQWLHSEDPEFLPKAEAVCDLYLNPPKGAVVVCVDEKPMQALERRHPTHVSRDDGTVRYEYEYKRHGTQVLLAAFDISTGRVLGQVLPQRTAPALVDFMEALARRYPTQQVHVVWDNLNVHYDGKDDRWLRFNARHGGRFRFLYTPKHASWMNQVEIWFSILHRRIIRYGDFGSTDHQKNEVEAFIGHWNKSEAHPFRWTWRTDHLKNRRRTATPAVADAQVPS
jgi:transposase